MVPLKLDQDVPASIRSPPKACFVIFGSNEINKTGLNFTSQAEQQIMAEGVAPDNSSKVEELVNKSD